MITKNHKKTTTLLVAIAALSAILVAGSVAASSDHSAFAHKKGLKNSGIAIPTLTAQPQKCVAAGGTSPISGSCIATSANTIDESGGIVGGP
jgi:hypothetical protein